MSGGALAAMASLKIFDRTFFLRYTIFRINKVKVRLPRDMRGSFFLPKCIVTWAVLVSDGERLVNMPILSNRQPNTT
jgi:hypothetical protein